MPSGPTDDIAPTRSKPSIVDAKAGYNEETDYPHISAATFAHSRSFHALHDWPYRVKHPSRPGLQGWMQRAPVYTPDIVPDGGKFIEAVYTNAAGSRAYKLYIPSRYQGQALPLIVMLHGGTQTPDDFAAGTRMNLIAEEPTCLVVYPVQPSHANLAKCWNWFRASDQRRSRADRCNLASGISFLPLRNHGVGHLIGDAGYRHLQIGVAAPKPCSAIPANQSRSDMPGRRALSISGRSQGNAGPPSGFLLVSQAPCSDPPRRPCHATAQRHHDRHRRP